MASWLNLTRLAKIIWISSRKVLKNEQRLQSVNLRLTNVECAIDGSSFVLPSNTLIPPPQQSKGSINEAWPGWISKPFKIDVPRFDGTDSLGWTFKINQIFKFQQKPEDQLITVASFHMDNSPYLWSQWMQNNKVDYFFAKSFIFFASTVWVLSVWWSPSSSLEINSTNDWHWIPDSIWNIVQSNRLALLKCFFELFYLRTKTWHYAWSTSNPTHKLNPRHSLANLQQDKYTNLKGIPKPSFFFTTWTNNLKITQPPSNRLKTSLLPKPPQLLKHKVRYQLKNSPYWIKEPPR